jgi:hypothetical protein
MVQWWGSLQGRCGAWGPWSGSRPGAKLAMSARAKCKRNDHRRSPECLGDTPPGSRFTPTCSAGSAGPHLAQIQEGEPPWGGILPPGIVKACSSTKRSIGREGVKCAHGSAWVISGRDGSRYPSFVLPGPFSVGLGACCSFFPSLASFHF